MMVVGITGGIGSGKSLISRLLRMRGFAVYDSDTRAKALYDEDEMLRSELIHQFGEHLYKDGVLDRRALATVVFSDAQKLAALDALVHPAVFRDFELWRSAHSDKIVFVESALLLQTDFRNLVDRVVLVDAPLEVRLQRAAQRDGTTECQIAQRAARQLSSDEMRQMADFVIINDDSQSVLIQVDTLVKCLEKS